VGRDWVSVQKALDDAFDKETESRRQVETTIRDDSESPVTVTWLKAMPSWYSQAACMTVENWDEVFFGTSEDGRDSLNQERVRKAQATCHSCPVIRDCAQHALLKPEEHGIWAGTTPKMRERAQDLILTGHMDLVTVIEVIVEGNAFAFKDYQASLSQGLKDVI
jgi:WhiB family redox-sensing transcriptional regulator